MNTPGKSSKFVFILALSIILSACAQLLMKAGMIELAARPNDAEWLTGDVLLHSGIWVVSGLTCYAGSMIAWLLVLSRWPLSLAYPMLSLSYVLVYIGAVLWPFIGESISLTRSCGILLVMAGVVLINLKPSGN